MESFTCFCKLPDTFYKFFHDACKILFAWKFNCCRELLQNFSMQHAKISMNISKYTRNQKFVIVPIYSFHYFLLCPLKDSICKRCFSLGKNRTFQQFLSDKLVEKHNFRNKTKLKFSRLKPTINQLKPYIDSINANFRLRLIDSLFLLLAVCGEVPIASTTLLSWSSEKKLEKHFLMSSIYFMKIL